MRRPRNANTIRTAGTASKLEDIEVCSEEDLEAKVNFDETKEAIEALDASMATTADWILRRAVRRIALSA